MLNICRCWVDVNAKEMCNQIFNQQSFVSFAYALHLLNICLLLVSYVIICAMNILTSMRHLYCMCSAYAEFIQLQIHLDAILVRQRLLQEISMSLYMLRICKANSVSVLSNFLLDLMIDVKFNFWTSLSNINIFCAYVQLITLELSFLLI